MKPEPQPSWPMTYVEHDKPRELRPPIPPPFYVETRPGKPPDDSSPPRQTRVTFAKKDLYSTVVARAPPRSDPPQGAPPVLPPRPTAAAKPAPTLAKAVTPKRPPQTASNIPGSEVKETPKAPRKQSGPRPPPVKLSQGPNIRLYAKDSV